MSWFFDTGKPVKYGFTECVPPGFKWGTSGTALPGTYPARLNPVPQGWECPRCQRINAPSAQQCTCGPLAGLTPETPAGLS